MKKQFLFCFLAFLFFDSIGQTDFCFKAGMNINDISGKNIPDNSPAKGFYKTSIGYNVGAFGDVQLSPKFRFTFELEYSQRGSSYKNPFTNADTRLKLNYIGVPLSLSYVVIKNISLDLGINGSYMISAFVKVDNINNSRKLDNRFDLAILSGLRYKLSDYFSVLARYSYSFTPVFESQFLNLQNNTITTGTYHNSNIQLGLAYSL